MKLKELLLEIRKEHSGFFIDARGTTHKITGGDETNRVGIEHLIDIGWIRVMIVRQMAGMYESDYKVYIDIPDEPSKIALGTLHHWLKEEPFVYQDYIIRRENMDGSFTKREAADYVKRVMTFNESLTEANIPSTGYGYWIRPDGTFISVDELPEDETAYGEHHITVMQKYFPDMPFWEASKKAMLRGWIRTVNDRRMSTLYTGLINPSKKA